MDYIRKRRKEERQLLERSYKVGDLSHGLPGQGIHFPFRVTFEFDPILNEPTLTNLKFYTALRVGKEASSKDRIDAKIHKRYPSCTNPATNGDTQPFEDGDRAWHSSNLLFVDHHFPRRLGCWDRRSRPCWKRRSLLFGRAKDREFLEFHVPVRIVQSRIRPCWLSADPVVKMSTFCCWYAFALVIKCLYGVIQQLISCFQGYDRSECLQCRIS